ncbi:hypothetical protein AAEX28_15395 [Lentisphaerota bacterium WC36G]|nr:hypothetical protein LJT99_02155 [Lentisphaerae bacterium WC36]
MGKYINISIVFLTILVILFFIIYTIKKEEFIVKRLISTNLSTYTNYGAQKIVCSINLNKIGKKQNSFVKDILNREEKIQLSDHYYLKKISDNETKYIYAIFDYRDNKINEFCSIKIDSNYLIFFFNKDALKLLHLF